MLVSALGGKRSLAFVGYRRRMPIEHAQSQHASYAVPRWAAILSWTVPLFLCAGLFWVREAPWTKGTLSGLMLTYAFGFVWIRMVVRLGRGEPIPSFLRKSSMGGPVPNSWFDGHAGILLQTTAILGASVGLALYW